MKVSMIVDGDGIVLTLPKEERVMTEEEEFVATCFGIWSCARDGDPKAKKFLSDIQDWVYAEVAMSEDKTTH